MSISNPLGIVSDGWICWISLHRSMRFSIQIILVTIVQIQSHREEKTPIIGRGPQVRNIRVE